MPMQAFTATLNILLFRGGPQDFPYSTDPQLSRACIAVAIVASGLFFGLSTPPFAALLAGAIAVGGVALFTRVLLRVRHLENRQTQTLNALLAAGSVLLLLMCLPASILMPMMQTYVAQVQQNPELANQPDAIPKFPVGPALAAEVLSIWFIAVSAHVFRHAANLGFFSGAMIALLCMFNIMMLLVFTTPLIALFGG